MTFTIALLVLLMQRLWGFDNKLSQYDLFMKYYRWLHTRFSDSAAWAGLSGVLLIVLPGFFISLVALMLIYHLLGVVIYYLVSLFVLWYYLDARRLPQDLIGDVSAQAVLEQSYQRIFAILFWFALFGALGVIFYTLVASLRIELDSQEQLSDSEHQLLEATQHFEGLLDWVPVRLLGLTYALVGEFGATFQAWSKALLSGIQHSRDNIVDWALVSMGYKPTDTLTVDGELAKSIESLINRALLVWLVVMGLFTIGYWVG